MKLTEIEIDLPEDHERVLISLTAREYQKLILKIEQIDLPARIVGKIARPIFSEKGYSVKI